MCFPSILINIFFEAFLKNITFAQILPLCACVSRVMNKGNVKHLIEIK